MLIFKFGGTSIGTPERMKKVAGLISDSNRKIVVLSAVAGTTDRLEKIAGLLYSSQKEDAVEEIERLKQEYLQITGELFSAEDSLRNGEELIEASFNYISGFTRDIFTPYEERALLAQGELLSSALFYLYLLQQKIKPVILPALDFMRIDDDGEPQPEYIKDNLLKLLSGHPETEIFITQGYICRNSFGEIDNLKRGGSDYSATLIGAAVIAEEVQIWTDIDGMHNNDPRVIKETRSLKELSYDEAAELAYFGAKILHPSSVLPAQRKGIPVRLKNTLNPDAYGTLISQNTTRGRVKAVVAKDGITAIKIKSDRMLLAYGFLRKIFEIFEVYKTPIDMITTSEVAVSITIDRTKDLDQITSELRNYGEVEIDRNQTIICLVGDFLADNKGYASLVFDALAEVPVRMISYGGSKHNISILVAETDKYAALKALNDRVFEERKADDAPQ